MNQSTHYYDQLPTGGTARLLPLSTVRQDINRLKRHFSFHLKHVPRRDRKRDGCSGVRFLLAPHFAALTFRHHLYSPRTYRPSSNPRTPKNRFSLPEMNQCPPPFERGAQACSRSSLSALSGVRAPPVDDDITCQ